MSGSFFGSFYLDKEKDMIVELYRGGARGEHDLSYRLRTPSHGTGNLITNLAVMCRLPLSEDENGLKIIEGEIPCYVDGYNRTVYIFRLGNTKVANIYPDGTIEMKASVPAITKTLMSQTKQYLLGIEQSIVKTFIRQECKFRTDLHTHMNANLRPDILIALGICHQIRYPLYYIKKLNLSCTDRQWEMLNRRREQAEERFADCGLSGKLLTRRIDDNTFINFADLILNAPQSAAENIPKIRRSLAILKDGQAVFTNLEKVYLYRYVFTKGIRAEDEFVWCRADEADAAGIPAQTPGTVSDADRHAPARESEVISGMDVRTPAREPAVISGMDVRTPAREPAVNSGTDMRAQAGESAVISGTDVRSLAQAAETIPDADIRAIVQQILRDRTSPAYRLNTLFQDKLLWIARSYQAVGIQYAEISDTTLVKKDQAAEMLAQVHAVMPAIQAETGVLLRFLAGIRRIPLTIVRHQVELGDYFSENIRVLQAIADDPYVAGSDIIGEEINDIRELLPVIRQIVRIAAGRPSFVVRIHAGENDSLRDNVANSLRCVQESLAEGQAMPRVRIGHGLYTANLKSPKGRELIRMLQESHAVLEFQITSNVRLNNLSVMDNHPLRQYLRHGIRCVQGTDGGALYGTDSIDEQLALEKFLNLSREELLQMRHSEEIVLADSLRAFEQKRARWEKEYLEFWRHRAENVKAESEPDGYPSAESGRQPLMDLNRRENLFPDHSLGDGSKKEEIAAYYSHKIDESVSRQPISLLGERQRIAQEALADRIREFPSSGLPVVIAGGSFNNDRHRTVVHPDDARLIDLLLEKGDPEAIFFVIGHRLTGYENYLIQKNREKYQEKFRIYAIVPALISPAEERKLRKTGVGIRVSIEQAPMGLYKSFAYELFKRRFSVLLAFDGNSAGANMIQEARNSRYKCRIYVSRHSRILRAKAHSLGGYVREFDAGSVDSVAGEVCRKFRLTSH